MISASELDHACEGLRTRGERGHWYRAIPPQYLAEALEVQHALGVLSRFHQGGAYLVLYLAGGPDLSQFESDYVIGRPGVPGGTIPNPRVPALTIVRMTVNLSAIVDLTDDESLHAVSTTAQELTGDWRGYRDRSPRTRLTGPAGSAPTQDLGQALFTSGRLEGFVTFCAHVPYEPNLCVFPERMQPSSYVEYSWTEVSGVEQTRRIPALEND